MSLLTASYLTLAGSRHDEHKPRYSALDRAKAAHAVGIPGIGVLLDEYLDPKIPKYAEITECEWVELDNPISKENRAALEYTRDYGCTLLKTGLCDAYTPAWKAEENLLTVIDAARHHGMTVAFEPVAWGNLPSLDDVHNVMTRDGYPSKDVGICYDLWQVAVGTPWIKTDEYPVSSIAKVEISGVDFQMHGTIAESAMDRPLIAESHIDINAWVQRLRAQGFTGLVTYEQPVARWRELTLMQTAEAAADDMSKITEM